VSWLSTLKDALHAACIDYDLADTHIDPMRLQRYDVVFVQTCDFMDRADQERLLPYRDRLVLGPGIPYLDQYLRPHGCLDGVRVVPESELPGLVRTLPPPEYTINDTRLDLVLHHDGARQLLFLSNPTTSLIQGSLRFSGRRTFTSAWGSSRVVSCTSHMEIALSVYEVQVWQVEQ
jgi:hypothetical protein